MASPHRPSPLRLSDTAWVNSGIVDQPHSADAKPGESSSSSSSSLDLVPAPRASDLQIVLRTRDHAAYYDAASNELSLQKHPMRPRSVEDSGDSSHDDAPLVPHRGPRNVLQRFHRAEPLRNSTGESICPTCARPWPIHEEDLDADFDTDYPPAQADHESPAFIAPNYFRLLAQASTTSTTTDTNAIPESSFSPSPSRPPTPRNRFSSVSGTSTPQPASSSGTSTPPPEPLSQTSSAQGYYSRFFIELHQLGRGARGTVYLCQHVLNGNKLGKYAVKKVPVGDHAQSLLQSLNEVHLMESLHHENLVGYQHAWIESWKEPRRWGPEVPTLFVLMMAANGGSLADWISRRAGEGGDGEGGKEGEEEEDGGKGEKSSVGGGSERKKIETLKAALRQRRAARSASTTSPNPPPAPTTTTTTPLTDGAAIHLLRTEEIYSLLTDIVSGLSFLHSRGILHLDIKPGNILLHWDEDSLIPRALLSDFGSSLFLHDNWTRVRSGHTGTMEYMSPEAVLVNPLTGKLDELSSKSDVWSVGMILHLLVFFRLPWEGDVDDLGRLRGEIGRYKGFSRPRRSAGKERARGDEVLLGLLERMLQVDASRRPSCEDVLEVLRARRKEGKKERRKRGRDEGEKSSLALYRPAALPPLPLSPGETDLSFPVAGRSIARQVAHRLPRESLAVTFALLKILSPHLVAYVLPTSSPPQATLLQADTINFLILLLALVDLATASGRAEGRRRGVGVVCRVGHGVLLLAVVGKCMHAG
ncbi:putative serine/threonine-protein kinase IKS1 [Pseudozyma hubeiensis]|nr:putative serine/threonine-protein kinase IKS1 [Pseudozyma hubeiensis]